MMNRKHPLWLVLIWIPCILLLASCNSGGIVATPRISTSPTDMPPADIPVTTATPTPVPIAPGAITSLDQASQALIRIRSKGRFLDPPSANPGRVPGLGSGFIISPSGLAVTSHHVVTGAEEISVWVGDDSLTVHPARLLGVSECSDLARIDIEGDGFP